MNSLRVTSAGRSARRVVIWLAVGMLLETVSLASLSLGADSRDDEAPVDFALDVQPIFARSCQMCHGPQKLRGGLRLDERASVLAGGDSGEPAIAPTSRRAAC
jgi:mono/diheme cytochrome c family protein